MKLEILESPHEVWWYSVFMFGSIDDLDSMFSCHATYKLTSSDKKLSCGAGAEEITYIPVFSINNVHVGVRLAFLTAVHDVWESYSEFGFGEKNIHVMPHLYECFQYVSLLPCLI